MAQIVKLIATESVTGKGTDDDPVRTVYELWTLNGEQVASYDVHTAKGHWEGRVGPQGEEAP